jgi:RNA polymerase sigma factor (sigma-70 family)
MANAPLGAVVEFIHRIASDKAYADMSDSGLVKRFFAEKDEKAFVVLLKRHGPMVLKVGRHILGHDQDVEDIFQATFLLLTRKAKSIRKHESVASWLYGVAQRLALKMKDRGANRHARERQAAEMRNKALVSDKAWQGLQTALHDALAQLPEKYRAALLLCYLEGKTQEEAARHLGCPIGTIRSRLARGRACLQKLLEQRGLPLSATALAAAFGATNASASVAPTLVRATAKAALAYASGQAATALVSAKVAALLETGLKTLAIAKVKTTAAVGLIIGVLLPAVGGMVVYTQTAMGTFAAPDVKVVHAKPAAQVPAPKAAPGDAKQLGPESGQTLSGRVLDVDGKPAAGAKLLLVDADEKLHYLGISGTEGRFAVTLPNKAKPHYLFTLVDGSGIDFIGLWKAVPPDPVELRVVKDNVIRGRVVNTEGKVVAGAKVSVSQLAVFADNSVDSFFALWKKRYPTDGFPTGVNHFRVQNDTSSFLSAVTDASGRFTLAGVGTDRMAELRIRGPGIAESTAWVVNRDGFNPKEFNQTEAERFAAMNRNLGPGWLRVLHGPDLSVVAEAEKPIRGIVKDIDTGQPRAGVKVWLSREGDTTTLLPLVLSTTSDASGRYEIHGARRSKAYMLEVGSDPAAGYLACQVFVTDTAGYEPINADIAVKKGVVVTGRVIDAATRKPVVGWARAGVLSANSFVKDYPEFGSSASAGTGTAYTKEDGTFRLVTIPGLVVLAGGPDSQRMPHNLDSFKYKPALPDPMYPQYFHKGYGSIGYDEAPRRGFASLAGNFCKVLDIKPGVGIVTQDIIIEPATALPVMIQDGDGRPVTGAFVTGINGDEANWPLRLEKETCAAYDLQPGKPRLMVFFEPATKLLGTLAFKGDEKEAAVVTLGAAGVVKGRLVGEDGKPLVGVVVNLHFPERTAAQIHDHIHRAKLVETDSAGAFQIDEVIPGPKFSLWFKQGVRFFEPFVQMDDSSVQAGATLDVGEIKLKPKSE